MHFWGFLKILKYLQTVCFPFDSCEFSSVRIYWTVFAHLKIWQSLPKLSIEPTSSNFSDLFLIRHFNRHFNKTFCLLTSSFFKKKALIFLDGTTTSFQSTYTPNPKAKAGTRHQWQSDLSMSGAEASGWLRMDGAFFGVKEYWSMNGLQNTPQIKNTEFQVIANFGLLEHAGKLACEQSINRSASSFFLL